MNENRGKNAGRLEEMPTRVRVTQLPRVRRSLIFGKYAMQYDVMYADGTVIENVDIGRVLQGSRYPADYHATVEGARSMVGYGQPGTWVDYPYGKPITSPS